MKKYTLFSFIFILSLILLSSVSVKSASAANCALGELFSSVTGQSCGNSISVVGCQTGYAFSPVTGQACSSATLTGPSDNSSAGAQFNNLFKSKFKVGLRGNSDVVALQQFLKDQGYYFGKIDGSYGKISARAVSDFQIDNNIGSTITSEQPPVSTSNTIISPASGEQWGVGTTQTIRWIPIAGASKVVISLKNNIPGPIGCETMLCQYGGNNRTYLLTKQGIQAPNIGLFSWKVGDFSEEQDTALQLSSIIPGTYAVIIQGLDANGNSAGFSSSTSNWFNIV